MNGWIKLYRKVLDNPVVCKDADHLAIWIYLLLNATHSNYDSVFKKERITLISGQLITGRKSISTVLKIDENKVQRVLKTFENEHQIEQQTSNQNRLITILNWTTYQDIEQQNEQQVNNERTTDEQRVNTNKNVKNDKNNINIYTPVVEYLNLKCNTKYKASTNKTKTCIDARVNEGFILGDFKKVIDIKAAEWLNTDMEKYLRPETLFGNKFESYLNQKNSINNVKKGSDNVGKYGNNIKFIVPKAEINTGTTNLDEEIRELGLL